jgi:hypothetical protein
MIDRSFEVSLREEALRRRGARPSVAKSMLFPNVPVVDVSAPRDLEEMVAAAAFMVRGVISTGATVNKEKKRKKSVGLDRPESYRYIIVKGEIQKSGIMESNNG